MDPIFGIVSPTMEHELNLPTTLWIILLVFFFHGRESGKRINKTKSTKKTFTGDKDFMGKTGETGKTNSSV